MYGLLDISASGMVAQRTRMTVIAANIANKDAVLDSAGNVNPYRARRVYFEPGDPGASSAEGRKFGVHVREIDADPAPHGWRWDPDSPLAQKTGPKAGYVPTPNVNTVVERLNALEASRAYEANVVAAEASKAMVQQALRLLA